MSGPTHACPGCGTAVSTDIKFCGQCGRDLRGAFDAAAPAPAPAPAPASAPAPAPAPAAAPASATPGGDKRTMLGMPAVQMQAQAADPAPPPAAPAPAPAQGPRRDNRTMLGMTAPVAPTPAPTSAPVASPAPAEPSAPSAGPEQPKAPAPNTNRTMLGMTAPVAPAPASAPALASSEARPEARLPAASNRTMLGMSARRVSEPPAAPAHPPRERSAVKLPEDFESGTYAPPRRGPSPALVLGVLGALVVLAAVGGVAAYFLFGKSGGDVRATVVQGEEGEQLRVEVAGAPAGTKARFAGQERPLEGGTASFPLSADALRVGDNELAIDVVEPGGDVEQATVTLEVRYRVRADLSGLERDPPGVDVVVDALPGSEVTLDGEPLALDADGRGRKSYPIAEADADAAAYSHEAQYRIRLSEGAPEEGVVRTRVPYAQMQLDRPGTDVVTDRAEIEIAAAVHSGARVTVDGTAVDVNDGRFVHRFPLPESRTYEPRIVVRQAGRAPRVETIRIRKVDDMAAEAASFQPDDGVSYARIQQNPSIYRGQRIAIEGRVYNVTVQGGRSDVQILVRDCPRGQRCPLWVSYPAAAEVTADDWVRVLGTVGGEQQFRSESNRVITVPRVDAQFLLPLER